MNYEGLGRNAYSINHSYVVKAPSERIVVLFHLLLDMQQSISTNITSMTIFQTAQVETLPIDENVFNKGFPT